MLEKNVKLDILIPEDIPDILEISKDNSHQKLSHDDFLILLKKDNILGRTARLNKGVVGYILYSIHDDGYSIIDMAVDKICQKNGVGTSLINVLKEQILYSTKNKIIFIVRETNLPMQLFLKKHGFLAASVRRNEWKDGDDGYVMKYLKEKPNET